MCCFVTSVNVSTALPLSGGSMAVTAGLIYSGKIHPTDDLNKHPLHKVIGIEA